MYHILRNVIIYYYLLLCLYAYGDYDRQRDVKFSLFTSMDDNFAVEYHNYTILKDLNIASNNSRPHALRIYGGLSLLRSNGTASAGSHDWIVYLDADAIVSELQLPLDLLLNKAKDWTMQMNMQSEECQFIAQDAGTLVNSGFWMLRNSSWSIDFLERWRQEVESASDYDYKIWVYDQGPLMNVILNYAANITNSSYDGYCWKGKEMLARNFCYARVLKQLGFPSNKRKIGPICLLPNDQGLPLRHHSHRGEIRHKGEMILHWKALSGELMNRSNQHLRYNRTSQQMIFSDGMILKGHTKALFLVENGTRHPFSGWNSFVERGYDIDDVVPVDWKTLNDVPLGSTLENLPK